MEIDDHKTGHHNRRQILYPDSRLSGSLIIIKLEGLHYNLTNQGTFANRQAANGKVIPLNYKCSQSLMGNNKWCISHRAYDIHIENYSFPRANNSFGFPSQSQLANLHQLRFQLASALTSAHLTGPGMGGNFDHKPSSKVTSRFSMKNTIGPVLARCEDAARPSRLVISRMGREEPYLRRERRDGISSDRC